jgi:hypothetical protein
VQVNKTVSEATSGVFRFSIQILRDDWVVAVDLNRTDKLMVGPAAKRAVVMMKMNEGR